MLEHSILGKNMQANGPQKRKSRHKLNPIPFKLRNALENETHFLISTTLPAAKHINKLWDLVTDTRDEIAWCLNMVYSHITMRGAHSEGKEHFFHHVAGTALYESHQGKLIKGKNHGLKAGGIVSKILKTIEKITLELNTTPQMSPEHREILENFKAELIAHFNTLVHALHKLPLKDKEHLKKFQNLDVESLKPIELKAEDKIRIVAIHPSPEQITPKKLSQAARKSQEALQSTEPPPEDIDSIFARLIQGTMLEQQLNETPWPIKKLIFDNMPSNKKDEIDEIFEQFEQRELLIKRTKEKKHLPLEKAERPKPKRHLR